MFRPTDYGCRMNAHRLRWYDMKSEWGQPQPVNTYPILIADENSKARNHSVCILSSIQSLNKIVPFKEILKHFPMTLFGLPSALGLVDGQV